MGGGSSKRKKRVADETAAVAALEQQERANKAAAAKAQQQHQWVEQQDAARRPVAIVTSSERAGSHLDTPGEAMPTPEVDELMTPCSPWEAVADNSGKTYYANTQTGEASWTKPAGFVASPEVQLLSGPIIELIEPVDPVEEFEASEAFEAGGDSGDRTAETPPWLRQQHQQQRQGAAARSMSPTFSTGDDDQNTSPFADRNAKFRAANTAQQTPMFKVSTYGSTDMPGAVRSRRRASGDDLTGAAAPSSPNYTWSPAASPAPAQDSIQRDTFDRVEEDLMNSILDDTDLDLSY